MRDRFARALTDFCAVRLSAGQPDWGQAMIGEVEAAIDDGQGLSFAVGCLVASLRQGLVQGWRSRWIGRALISAAVALPVAIFHLGCTVASVILFQTGRDAFSAGLEQSGHDQAAQSYLSAAPLLGLLMATLAVAHLSIAVHCLRWRPKALAASLAVAGAAGVMLITAIHQITGGFDGAVWQVAGLFVELILITLIARKPAQEAHRR